MDITVTCRDVAELAPNAQLACRLLFQQCFKAGIDTIFVTETYRSKERQQYLYAQGRTRPGAVVTWTLNSNHASRLAWDIACSSPSLYDYATLTKVGEVAEELGITWGGNWDNNVDRPHFEIQKKWQPPAHLKLEGTVIVPSNSKQRVQLYVKDKEEVNMANIWDPGSSALREQAESLLDRAVKEGMIKSSHLKDLQNGEMTTDRLLGLYMKITQSK